MTYSVGHYSQSTCYRLVVDVLEIKDDHRLQLRPAVTLDYYVGALWWSKEQSHTADQMSAFFTVIDTLMKNIGGFV